jgi:TonB-linked SusC/RagA family outer membrane protein
MYDPLTPAYTSDGKLVNTLYLRGNTIGHLKEGGVTTQHDYNIDLLMGLTYKVPFVDGLSVSTKYSINPNITSVKRQDKKHTVYNVVRKGSHGLIFTDEVISSELSGYPATEKLEYSYNIGRSYQLNLMANYNKSFGKHGLDAVFVYERSEGDNVYTLAQRFDYPLLRRDQIWATGSSRLQGAVDGNESQNGRSSYIGRAVYNYGEKYFVNLTARYDGSMLFAPGYRWGFFPSVSASWALSKEDFFNVDFIDFLKIRSAFGNSGNDAVGGWAWSESFSNVGSYLLSSLQPMVRYGGIANKVLTWEKTREWNIGFDSKFLKGCMLNMDYYFKHNYDILDTRIVSLPISFGGSMPPENYGIVDAHGIEVELGYTGKIGKVNFGVMGNFAYSTNEVKLRDVAQNVRKVDNPNGRPTDYIKTYVATGILRTQADLDALPAGYTINGLKPRLGMLNYQDVSGPTEGVPDGIISSFDSQVLEGKHSNPPYMFGLNINADWKGLGIDLFFQGAAGVWKTRSDRAFAEATFIRNYKYFEDMWTPENPNAAYPMGVGTGTYSATSWIGSDFWIENGSYLRLQQLNLRYSLPKNITKKLRLPDDITFNLSGTNLFTITGFHAYDVTSIRPETYPIVSSYTMGINVTF